MCVPHVADVTHVPYKDVLHKDVPDNDVPHKDVSQKDDDEDEDEDDVGDECTTCGSCFAPEGRGWTGLQHITAGWGMVEKEI